MPARESQPKRSFPVVGRASVLLGAVASLAGAARAQHIHHGGVYATSSWDYFTNFGRYMPRTHCLMTESGEPDWVWIGVLAVLQLGVIVGYLRIFSFWRRSYLREKPEDRNQKMMDLAYIFLWCATCGYGMSLVIFVWPAYRLLAVFLAVLCFFTWRFAWNIDELGLSLAAKRLQRQLGEVLGRREKPAEEALRARTLRVARRDDRLTRIRFGIALAVAALVALPLALFDTPLAGFIAESQRPGALLVLIGVQVAGAVIWWAAIRPQQRRSREHIDELHAAVNKINERNDTLRRLSLVAAKTDNAVIITDAAGRIEWINEGFTRLTGYELGEVEGKSPGGVLQGPETDLQTMAYMREKLAGGEGFQAEVLNYTKFNRTYWVALDVQPIHDEEGNLTNYIAIERDVTERKRVEQQLRESGEQLQLGLDAARGGAWDWEVKIGRVRHTPRFLDLFGFEAENVKPEIGFWEERIHPSDRAEVERLIEEHFDCQSDNFRCEYRIRNGRGEYIWTLACGRVVSRDSRGQPERMQGINFDISDRKNAEAEMRESERRFRSAFEQAAVGIAHVSPDGRWLRVNRKTCDILGYPAERLCEVTVRDLTHPEDVEVDSVLLDRTLSGLLSTYAVEKRMIRRDGTVVWVNLTVSLVRTDQGSPSYFVSVLEDISGRKAAEEKIRAAKEQAESASRAKSEFLASMSHELRTPLNGVIGMTDLLRETPLDDRQQRFVEACHASASSLLGVINDILDFSKIEAGRLELDEHEFPFDQCIEDSVQLMAIRAHAAGLELVCEIDPALRRAVVGDSVRLRQILVNLVGNAVKFTEEGCVRVRATVESQDSAYIVPRIEVIDTGIGIPQDRVEHLFKSFSQADRSTTRRYGGTGLGLVISKQLAGAMGGKIGVESKPGEGSNFWFTIRLRVAHHPAPEGLITPGELASLRVVLLAGDARFGGAIENLLRAWGMEVRRFGSATDFRIGGQEAMDFMAAADLVIVDIPVSHTAAAGLANSLTVPRVNGRPKLMALAPTVGDAPDLFKELHRVDHFLTKPPVASELLSSITRLFCTSPEQQPHQRGKPDADAALPAAAVDAVILVAEDNTTNQLYIRELLERAGYACEIVSDGRRAVERASSGEFDLILMDCQMPELDGFDATREIRRVERMSMTHVPILALTANAIRGDRERCLEAGMDDYLAKPVNARRLLEKIAEMLTGVGPASGHAPPSERVSPLEEGTGVSPGSPGSGGEAGDMIIDAAGALERCMGDSEFLAMMLETFLHETPTVLGELEAAVARADAEAVRSHAHALKGAAGAITAEPLRSVASRLELIGRESRLDEAQPTFQELSAEFERCLASVRALLGTLGDAPGAEPEADISPGSAPTSGESPEE